MVLDEYFYRRENVVTVARNLLGKILFTRVGNKVTSGVIVETEAYSWKERGCHAYGKRKTPRNEVMFQEGGCAYVYLCYGIHNLFNVVTNKEGLPEAVLIRALEPYEGLPTMMKRAGAKTVSRLSSGPGKLTKALGIDRKMSGKALNGSQIWIEDQGIIFERKSIQASARIGIDYAGNDAELPWRFTLKDNSWVSK